MNHRISHSCMVVYLLLLVAGVLIYQYYRPSPILSPTSVLSPSAAPPVTPAAKVLTPIARPRTLEQMLSAGHLHGMTVLVSPPPPFEPLPNRERRETDIAAYRAQLEAIGIDPATPLLIFDGFAASESGRDLLAYSTAYKRIGNTGTPVLITSDSLFHLYHILYDGTIAEIEQSLLAPALERLVAQMKGGTRKVLVQCAAGSEREESARYAYRIFCVAEAILHDIATTGDTVVDIELGRIYAAAGINRYGSYSFQETYAKLSPLRDKSVSELTGRPMDYAALSPGGRYETGQELKRYFVALKWLAMPFFCTNTAPLAGERYVSDSEVRLQTSAAFLVAALLARPGAYADYARIRGVYEVFVGPPDEVCPEEYADIAGGMGEKLEDGWFVPDGAAFDAVRGVLPALAPPLCRPSPPREQAEMALFPRNFTLDGYLMEVLESRSTLREALAIVSPRPSPILLMSALGSNNATAIAHVLMPERIMEKLRAQREMLDSVDAEGYSGNLTAMLAGVWHTYLADREGPSKLHARFWERRKLVSALSSFTALRHDLSATPRIQRVAVRTAAEPPNWPRVLVEPSPAVFLSLFNLTKRTKKAAELCGGDLSSLRLSMFESLATLLSAAANASYAGLHGQAPDPSTMNVLANFYTVFELVEGPSLTHKITCMAARIGRDDISETHYIVGTGFLRVMAVMMHEADGGYCVAAGPIATWSDVATGTAVNDTMWLSMISGSLMHGMGKAKASPPYWQNAWLAETPNTEPVDGHR